MRVLILTLAVLALAVSPSIAQNVAPLYANEIAIQGNGGHGLYGYSAYSYLADTYGGSVGKNVLYGNGTGGVFAEAGTTVMGGTSGAFRQNSFVENGQPGGQWFDLPGDVQEGPDAWAVGEGTVAYLRNGWWGRPANPDTTTCASVPCGGSFTGLLFVDPMLASDPGGGAFGRAALGSYATAPSSGLITGARARLLDAVDASVMGRRADAFALLQATADGARGALVGAVAVSETGRLAIESRRGHRSGDDVTAGALVSLNAWAAKGSPYRTRALATLVQVRHAMGDAAGALEAAAELAAGADPAAALEGHYARFHLLLGSARRDRAGYRGAAEALAVLERVAPESAQVGWARHALVVEGGTDGVRAMRDGANAGRLASAQAAETGEAASGETGLSVWPNPLAGRSTVGLTLAEASDVSVVLYDVLGREAVVVHRGRLDAGAHRLSVDGAALPAGTYVVRAQVGTRAALVRTLTVTR